MRTKVLIICVIICHSSLSLLAQNPDKRYHNFGSDKSLQVKGFFSPFAAFSNVEGTLSLDFGAAVGLIIKDNLIAGIYGQKMVSNPIRTGLDISDFPAITDGDIEMKHAGAIVGYNFKPEAVVHWGVNSSFGVGELELIVKDPVTLITEKTYTDRIYLVVPRLFAEMNVTKWLKINVSGGYRFFGKVNSYYTNQSGEEVPIFDKTDYTKPEFSVSMVFGSFGFRTATIF